jgi:hypothetical protein
MAFKAKLESVMMTVKAWSPVTQSFKGSFVSIHHMLIRVTVLNADLTDLMSHNTKIGIVTAAGYTEAERYYERLHGLLEAIKESDSLTPAQKQNLIVMGNFHLLFNSP